MKFVSEPSIRRLARYLRIFDELKQRGEESISSSELGQIAGATAAQVRRDLLALGGLGRRGTGYPVSDVARELGRWLAVSRTRPVYIIGAGKIGRALSRYPGFVQRGFRVVGVFDNDPKKVGTKYGDFTIRSIRDVQSLATKDRPEIALVAIPAESAQSVADELMDAGITGILNFAPVLLKVRKGIVVQNVDMTTELLVLAFRVEQRHLVTPKKRLA